MSSIVFSCHVQHATPQIINPFSPHLEFITHDLRSTRTVIYNFVSANHLMGSLDWLALHLKFGSVYFQQFGGISRPHVDQLQI